MGRAVGLALAATLIAWPAGAAGVALPLKAPPGADPLLADFVEICSAGVVDVTRGAALALGRGWATGNGEPNDKSTPFTALAAAALGTFGAVKPSGDGVVVMSITRAPFPHLAATTCFMSTQGAEGLAGLDPAVLSRIEGVRGGSAAIAAVQPNTGFWSLVDDTDRVVTMSTIPVGDRGLLLTMSRAVRLDPDTSLPLQAGQPAR